MREGPRIMAKRSTFRTLLRRAGPPAALLIVGSFFGGYAIFGPNGALAYGDIERQLAVRRQQLAALDQTRAHLKNRVELVHPDHADPDMVDQLVREKMGVVDGNEVVVPLR